MLLDVCYLYADGLSRPFNVCTNATGQLHAAHGHGDGGFRIFDLFDAMK